MKQIFISSFLLIISLSIAKGQVRIGVPSGSNLPVPLLIKVIDADTGLPISKVNCTIDPIDKGFSTDKNGAYELSLYTGRMRLNFSHLSYYPISIDILLIGAGSLVVKLETSISELEEVTITGNPDQNVKGTIGQNELSIESIKALPLFAGQMDVIKSLTLLPGVSSVGEISSGLNVRGGQADNNLVILGGAPIYNPSHLFGFFSAINGDEISNVSLYKGGIPARFGGRSSSVLDISTKIGDFKEWNGVITAGMVSSSITADGPIIKDKLSISVGSRLSYVDWLLRQSKDRDINSSNASFYDVNSTISFKPSAKSKIDYRTYYSFDDFSFISDTLISWSNLNHTLNWDYIVNDRTYLKVNLTNSNYSYSINNDPGPLGFKLSSSILDARLNTDILIEYSKEKSLNFGINSVFMRVQPGKISPVGNENLNSITIAKEKGLELSTFVEYKNSLSDKLAFEAGVRLNQYLFLGPSLVNNYTPDRPRNESNISSVDSFDNNEIIQRYGAINPRLGVRYSFTDDFSIKGGVNRLSQYIHLISNTTTYAPTDTWKLSDTHIKPNEAWIFSLGAFKNFGEKYELSAEVYYKPIINLVEYRDGANLLLNDDIETELLSGRGRAHGLELYLKKLGRLSGWVSYTYGRSFRKVSSGFETESINNGQWFPSNFDTPNNLSITMKYLIRKGVEFSSTFVYSDGKPVSFPTGKFNYQTQTVAYFENRNEFRIPSYHRLDISWTWDLESDYTLLDGDFTFSIYNLYGRNNAFSVFFDDVYAMEPQAFKLSILGSAFPAISYRIKFL